jgi:Protein of unknown function (DUF3551)
MFAQAGIRGLPIPSQRQTGEIHANGRTTARWQRYVTRLPGELAVRVTQLPGMKIRSRMQKKRANMKRPLTLGVAAISCAAIFATAAPAAAKDHEYCRRDITSYMLQCGFDTLARCQDMSFGRGGDCFRNPSLGSAADAYVYAPSVGKAYAYAPYRRK